MQSKREVRKPGKMADKQVGTSAGKVANAQIKGEEAKKSRGRPRKNLEGPPEKETMRKYLKGGNAKTDENEDDKKSDDGKGEKEARMNSEERLAATGKDDSEPTDRSEEWNEVSETDDKQEKELVDEEVERTIRLDDKFVTRRTPSERCEDKEMDEGNQKKDFDSEEESEVADCEACKCNKELKEMKELKRRLEGMERLIETLMVEKSDHEKKFEEIRIELNKEKALRIRDVREEREEIGIIKERLDQERKEIERGERVAEGMKKQITALRIEVNKIDEDRANEKKKKTAEIRNMERRDSCKERNKLNGTDVNGNETPNNRNKN